MILHLGFELPKAETGVLDFESPDLNDEEIRILKRQIRKNAGLIDSYIGRLDLFLNKERHPPKEAFIGKIRERLFLLMDENDTFRKVLWKQTQRDAFKEAAVSNAAQRGAGPCKIR